MEKKRPWWQRPGIVITISLVLLILLVRPTGLFGWRTIERV